METIITFILVATIMVAVIMITASNKKSHGGNHELSRSELYCRTHNPASKIYRALETTKILQNIDKCETFSSRESFLYELSKDIVRHLPNSHYEDYVDMAIKQYKQTYKTNIITRQQQEFIENPDIGNNHSFTAKLKTRSFADFCGAMQSEIDRLKIEKAGQKRGDHVKEVALSIIEYLRINNHVLLADGIVSDTVQLGVEIDKNLVQSLLKVQRHIHHISYTKYIPFPPLICPSPYGLPSYLTIRTAGIPNLTSFPGR